MRRTKRGEEERKVEAEKERKDRGREEEEEERSAGSLDLLALQQRSSLSITPGWITVTQGQPAERFDLMAFS